MLTWWFYSWDRAFAQRWHRLLSEVCVAVKFRGTWCHLQLPLWLIILNVNTAEHKAQLFSLTCVTSSRRRSSLGLITGKQVVFMSSGYIAYTVWQDKQEKNVNENSCTVVASGRVSSRGRPCGRKFGRLCLYWQHSFFGDVFQWLSCIVGNKAASLKSTALL